MKLGVDIKELKAAKLTDSEIELLPKYIDGELEFYASPAFNKLFEYYCFETGGGEVSGTIGSGSNGPGSSSGDPKVRYNKKKR